MGAISRLIRRIGPGQVGPQANDEFVIQNESGISVEPTTHDRAVYLTAHHDAIASRGSHGPNLSVWPQNSADNSGYALFVQRWSGSSPVWYISYGGDAVFDAGGPVLKSPNGHYWRLSVNNGGTVSATDLGTTAP